MPFGSGPSVVNRSGCDYWRTWFIEECEKAQLFGLTKGHLGLVTLAGEGIVPYNIGTKMYLEDAPYFRGSKTHHRICGPYEVIQAIIPSGASPVYVVGNKVIAYKDDNPERGPWFDRSTVIRNIEGFEIKFRQIAREYDYFPYRFAIRKAKNYKIEHVIHDSVDCWLCR